MGQYQYQEINTHIVRVSEGAEEWEGAEVEKRFERNDSRKFSKFSGTYVKALLVRCMYIAEVRSLTGPHHGKESVFQCPQHGGPQGDQSGFSGPENMFVFLWSTFVD